MSILLICITVIALIPLVYVIGDNALQLSTVVERFVLTKKIDKGMVVRGGFSLALFAYAVVTVVYW